jgi:hypothetical protein
MGIVVAKGITAGYAIARIDISSTNVISVFCSRQKNPLGSNAVKGNVTTSTTIT